MVSSISTLLFLILFCCLWDADARRYNSVISVTNGDHSGKLGEPQFCSKGYAKGFSLREGDNKSSELNGIRLHCTNGQVIRSNAEGRGKWTKFRYCPKGNLVSFSLRVKANKGEGDDTGVNNIQFICKDGSALAIHRTRQGRFGQWSRCSHSASICGIQTRVADPQGKANDTDLNDVKLFCCK